MRLGYTVRLATIAAAVLLHAASTARAQNNSLYRRVQPGGSAPAANGPANPGVPTTQPAGATAMFSNVPPPRTHVAYVTAAPQPPVNPVLYETSLIAVALPEPVRIKVHDLVTIIVREDKTTTSDTKTQSKKGWDVQSDFTQWFRLNPENHLVGQSFADPVPGVDFKFGSDWKGEGQVDRKDSLITRITATVIDIKPNGNLVLQARKTIKQDEESQIITLTGVCRAKDVTAQNTVLSTQVADTEITTEHTGAARDAARRGWLMRAFDFLRPI